MPLFTSRMFSETETTVIKIKNANSKKSLLFIALENPKNKNYKYTNRPTTPLLIKKLKY